MLYRNKIGRRINRCTNATLKGYVNNINEFPVVYSKLTELQRSCEECKRILDSVNNQTNKANFYIKNIILMF